MYIKFKSLKLSNVASYGSVPTEIIFDKGFFLISAQNGFGKSSILNALTYCLFGQPYTKIKIAELINRTNKKKLSTECTFFINDEEYKIIRNLKPDLLEVYKGENKLQNMSSKTLTQDEIDKILGIDYKMFKNVVALAVNYNKPFLALDAQSKRDIIETIFNVRILGEMLKVIKKKISIVKTDIEISNNEVKILEETIKTLKKNLDEISRSKVKFEEDKINLLKKLDLDILNNINLIVLVNKEISEIENNIVLVNQNSDKEKNDIESNLLIKRKENEAKIEDYKKQIISIADLFVNKLTDFNADIDLKLKEISDKSLNSKNELDKIELGDIDKLNSSLLKEYNEKSTFEHDKKLVEKKLDFFNKNDKCSECDREISLNEKNEKIEYLKKQLEFTNTNIDTLMKSITNKSELVNNEKKKKEKKDFLEKELSRLNNEKIQLESKLKLTVSSLNNEKTEKINNLTNYIVKLENNREIADLESKLIDFYFFHKSKIEKLQNEINNKKERIINIEKDNENLKIRINDENNKKFDVNIDGLKIDFDEKCKEYREKFNFNKNKLNELDNYNFSAEILSEKGIKSYFFQELVPIFNQKVNDYLNKFDIPISLTFNEMMEEKITSLNGRDQDISYYCFSEGEKKRIDISILFSFVDIMKMISNWNCNLLIMDEIMDSCVDLNGLEKITNSVKSLVEKSKELCSFVISHRLQDSFDVFDGIYKIEKIGGFSKVVKV